MNSLVGSTIDERYELLSEIGRGGMGAVYKAKQHPFDRIVALKMLPGQLGDAEAHARFEREAMAISALQHKNIVLFYGYGVWCGAPYMVMEHVDGRSLQNLLQKNEPLEPKFALRIIEQIAEGLSCAHAHGLVHRDLKPSNVMIVGDEGNFVAKIIDFGLAQLMPSFGKDVQKLTEAGAAVGSVLYMSPEQCIGKETDARSDIYALGAIFHHCLTGVVPFTGDHSVSVMHQHVSEATPRLDSSLPDSAALQALIDHAMQKDPKDRYQSADEFLADIRQLLKGNASVLAAKKTRITPLAIGQAKPKEGVAKKAFVAGLLAAGALWVSMHHESQPVPVRDPNELFRSALNSSNRRVAIPLMLEALEAERRTPLFGAVRRAEGYANLTNWLLMEKRFEEALEMAGNGLRDAAPASAKNMTPFGQRCYERIASNYVQALYGLNKPEEGTNFLIRQLRTMPDVSDRQKVRWLEDLVFWLHSRGRSREALEELEQTLPQIAEPEARIRALSLAPPVYLATNQHSKAVAAIQEIVSIFEKFEPTTSEAVTLAAGAYITMRRPDKGRKLLAQVPLHTILPSGHSILAVLALADVIDDNPQSAMQNFQRSWQCTRRLPESEHRLRAYTFLYGSICNASAMLKQQNNRHHAEFMVLAREVGRDFIVVPKGDGATTGDTALTSKPN
jgi:serine/threonine protein kinase